MKLRYPRIQALEKAVERSPSVAAGMASEVNSATATDMVHRILPLAAVLHQAKRLLIVAKVPNPMKILKVIDSILFISYYNYH